MKTIKLTKEILKKITPKTIIYAEFAEEGAMGPCGTARIYTLEDSELKFYLVEDIFDNKESEDVWIRVYDFLKKLAEDKVLTPPCKVFGNYIYKSERISFSRDYDNAAFIYEKDGKKYTIKTSCRGVYDHTAAIFAPREVSIETLDDYRRHITGKLSLSERLFLSEYIEQLERIDSGRSWYDFTAINYMDAIAFIHHLDGTDYILNEVEQEKCESALQKYRLKYVVDKIGWNKLNSIIGKLATKNKAGVFQQISEAISEDISSVYSTVETIKSTNTTDFDKLIDRPVLVDFSKVTHAAIIKDLVEKSGRAFNPEARSVAFYLANYILNEDKLSYADVLPAVAHIIEVMPNDDFNHTHIDDLFWLCGEIVNRAWRYLEEDEKTQKKYRDFIYDLYAPRVGGLWPVIHADEFEFKDKATKNIFDDSLNFLMSLTDIDERNPEIRGYLNKNARNTGYNKGALGRRAFQYTLKNLSVEEEFDQILKTVEPRDYNTFLVFPQGVEEAEILMNELFRTDEGARITGVSRLSVLEMLLMTPNTIGVGEFILYYIGNNFDEFEQIVSMESVKLGADPIDVLTGIFIATSKGITEENEFAPLKLIKKKLIKYGCDEPTIMAAEKYARRHHRTILFQRSALKKLF